MKTKFLALTILALFLFACDSESFDSESLDIESSNALKKVKDDKGGEPLITTEYLDNINKGLALADVNYRVLMAEYITTSDGDEAGQTVFAKDVGNKQLGADFVPFDPRREAWSGPIDDENDNITYAIDQTADATPQNGGLTGAETDAAIERATSTWQEANCSNLDLSRNNDFGMDIGYVAYSYGLGGTPYIFADIQHAGFNLYLGPNVLGVTFSYHWGEVNDDGVFIPSDIDNNGKYDTAFREIYYSVAYNWADDGMASIDVESIAVHELGHGLSQGHFGKVSVMHPANKEAWLKVSPRAVMNAIHTGPYRELNGTDNGGHCSIWAQWPNN